MQKPSLSLFQYIEPPLKMPLWQWVEKYIILSSRQSTAFPGPFRMRLVPFAKGVFDALGDPNIHTVVLEFAAQVGKTTIGYAWLAHCVAEDPGPLLVAMPSTDLARTSSQTRVMPMFEDSPYLAKLLPDDRKTFFQSLQYRIGGCVVSLTGSNNPAQVSSRPIRYLLADELDKMAPQSGKESDPVSLAIQRTKNFWNRKILLVSTPTTPDGQIHTHYLRGDQRRYYVPCPHCSAKQFLIWSQVKWEKDQPETALYHCKECDKQ